MSVNRNAQRLLDSIKNRSLKGNRKKQRRHSSRIVQGNSRAGYPGYEIQGFGKFLIVFTSFIIISFILQIYLYIVLYNNVYYYCAFAFQESIVSLEIYHFAFFAFPTPLRN